MDASVAQPTEPAVASPYGDRWTRWIRPVALALLLIVVDELGAFAVLVGAILILVYLPRSLLAKKYVACRKERLLRFAIYLTAVVVVLGLIQFSRRVAEERAATIIAAVEAYRAANGAYPERLEQLAPRFIAALPSRARLTFSDSGFRYFAASETSHTLMYVAIPPFGRRTYNFESKSWGFID